MLLRPALPWCFPIRQLSFEQKEQQQQQKGEKVAKITILNEEKVAKITNFYGFQKLRQGVLGCNFDASPSFTAMVLSHPGAVFWTGAAAAAEGMKK